jgi:S1-C subfamily serine protease
MMDVRPGRDRKKAPARRRLLTRAAQRLALALSVLFAPAALPLAAREDPSFAAVARQVNQKIVKVHGAGGFRGVNAYCTGVVISPDGFILTVYSPTLDSYDLRVFLYDGTRHSVELVAAEPQLDVALLRIKDRERFEAQPLPFVDLDALPGPPSVGDWVLAFSNAFEVAMGNEPVSVQRGVIAAVAPLAGRRGVAAANYTSTAYIVDAITNNPGSNGGLLTNRQGQPLGLIGKELKNTLSETWVNYAMPLSVLRPFAQEAMKGQYKPLARAEDEKPRRPLPYTGLMLMPDVVERTPPFVESVEAGSPADLAGLRADDLVVFIRLPRADGSGELEERVVTSAKVFRDTLAALQPGATIRLIVRRGAQLLSFDLKPLPPK